MRPLQFELEFTPQVENKSIILFIQHSVTALCTHSIELSIASPSLKPLKFRIYHDVQFTKMPITVSPRSSFHHRVEHRQRSIDIILATNSELLPRMGAYA